jgi:hypothetical protein
VDGRSRPDRGPRASARRWCPPRAAQGHPGGGWRRCFPALTDPKPEPAPGPEPATPPNPASDTGGWVELQQSGAGAGKRADREGPGPFPRRPEYQDSPAGRLPVPAAGPGDHRRTAARLAGWRSSRRWDGCGSAGSGGAGARPQHEPAQDPRQHHVRESKPRRVIMLSGHGPHLWRAARTTKALVSVHDIVLGTHRLSTSEITPGKASPVI